MNYDWKKLAMTVAMAAIAGVVGQGVLPAGWDGVIMSVVAAAGALHVSPPRQ